MSLLRIALGYPAKSRRSVPVVLAVGYSAKDIQAAVDAAPASVLRIETGWFHFHRLGKRGAGAVPAAEPEEPSEGEDVGALKLQLEEREAELAEVRERLAALEKQFESAVPKTPAGVGDEKSSAPAPAGGRKAAKDGGAARDGAAKGPKESDLSGEE